MNGKLKISDEQLDMVNLLAWRASSFFLDKQISTLQISASPTQRHILSKEIPYSFPWASLQTANLSIFLLYPPTASYHHHQRRSITFLRISLKKLINCKNTTPPKCKRRWMWPIHLCYFFPTLSVGILGQTNIFMQILGVFASFWQFIRYFYGTFSCFSCASFLEAKSMFLLISTLFACLPPSPGPPPPTDRHILREETPLKLFHARSTHQKRHIGFLTQTPGG